MASLESQLKGVVTTLFKKSGKKVYRRNPWRDWQKIIIGSFVVALGLLAVDGYFFFKINSGELVSDSVLEQKSLPSFDVGSVKQLNATYDAREEKQESLKTASDIPIDPSL